MRKIGLLMAMLAGLATSPTSGTPALIEFGPPTCLGCSLHPLYDEMHPLYNDKHVTYDSALEGRWQRQPGECVLVVTGYAKRQEYTLKFSAPPDNRDGCRLEPHLNFEQAGPFSGHLVQLGSSRFLDLDSPGSVASFGWIPVHMILKVWIDRKKLSWAQPSEQWLCDITRTREPSIGQCSGGGLPGFLFTASTEALQDFVQKHADDDQLFHQDEGSPLLRLAAGDTK